MRKIGDKDDIIGIENIFSFENSQFKDNNEFEEIIIEENNKYELYSNLE